MYTYRIQSGDKFFFDLDFLTRCCRFLAQTTHLLDKH